MDLKIFLLSLMCTFCTFSITAEAANILGLWTTPGKSHSIQGRALLEGLSQKGHNVTMVTCFATKVQTENYREIMPKLDILKVFYGRDEEVNVFEDMKNFSIFSVVDFFTSSPRVADAILSDEVIQNILKSKDKYDVVIVPAFLNEPLFAVAHHLKVPLIVYSLSGPSLLTDPLVGNPASYAYIPSFGHSHPMAFFQRVTNTLASVAMDLLRNLIYFPMQYKVHEKHFPNAPPLSEIMKDTALLLVNSHTSIGIPRPMVPNMIEIGGFNMKKKVGSKPLPAELKKTLDSAKDGAIYFSLGSAVKSTHLPVEIRDTILKTFAKLKQQVLWKWEDDKLPGKPKNVIVSKWFPQTDILAHPNVKLFITHGGWGSLCESISSAVPLVGMPVFGDQYDHVNEAKSQGFAVPMHFMNVTEESFLWAINEVLNNPSYKENALRTRELFFDREIDPMDRAAYWVEHVIRTKGAKHLRSPALEFNRAQLLLLDVIGFLALIFLVVTMILFYITRKLWNLCCGKKTKPTKSAKKNN